MGFLRQSEPVYTPPDLPFAFREGEERAFQKIHVI